MLFPPWYEWFSRASTLCQGSSDILISNCRANRWDHTSNLQTPVLPDFWTILAELWQNNYKSDVAGEHDLKFWFVTRDKTPNGHSSLQDAADVSHCTFGSTTQVGVCAFMKPKGKWGGLQSSSGFQVVWQADPRFCMDHSTSTIQLQELTTKVDQKAGPFWWSPESRIQIRQQRRKETTIGISRSSHKVAVTEWSC